MACDAVKTVNGPINITMLGIIMSAVAGSINFHISAMVQYMLSPPLLDM